ncbi:MAG TPA: serine/threonine-protein kinase, partial [Kofleriaceae bacterium]|nr:serine/threonine-protein kinase [Kofleriaceae bacterium]
AGFEKEIVIKRLRQELADDPRIVEMFLDEAKIGAQLNHPNIVHVYDVDEHDGIPYIAMEYIIGEELNELCRRGIAHDRFLPIEHAVELIRQAAAGMGYFHAKRADSEPLEIVHLDISPSNLLVTQDGFLKIIDFGIARYRGQHGRSDVLPGKLSYMSPEQAARGQVDHRSDIFSLGIVLYEITVGKRLFRGPAQEVVGRLIEATIEPPTFARRNFPPALESIVMRTLEKHPEDRYQSAYDLADDLESFLRDEKLHSGPVRIARYLDKLSLAAGGVRRPELISEAEARSEAGDELDFDSQVFDGFAPTEGAPGPEQAPLWEDVEQNDADVAAALHLELAELRALRTPVPMRPSGMMPVRGNAPLAGHVEEEEARVTNPVRRITGEYDAQDAPDDEEELATTLQTPKPVLDPPPASRATPVPREIAPQTSAPVGAAYLARTGTSKLPWLLVGMLGVAVLSLVAYIVMQ